MIILLDFRPPRENRLVIGLTECLLPVIMRFKGLGLDIDSESMERLRATDGFPTILVPNHPTDVDPFVIFTLSKRLGERFRYVAARETFHLRAGGRMRGFLMQRLGAYSVVRGAVDRESFRTTRGTLTKGKHKVVIFAEGEVSFQNDTVMPFESGGAQMGFWALDDLEKAGQVKPMYVAPVAIKYVYEKDMWREIEKALTKLERKILRKNSSPSEDLYDRLQNVGAVLLITLAKEYQLPLSDDSSLNERIQLLRGHILSQMENFMGIVPQSESSPLKRVRTIQNRIDEEVYREEDEMTEYEGGIHRQGLDKFRQFYIDLNRVVNFIAIYEGYVGENPTQERFLEVIARLEKEVYGFAKTKGPRTALIRVATPRNLLDDYEAYKKEKRNIVERITLKLEGEVQKMVSDLSK